jgi:hypothetical protein
MTHRGIRGPRYAYGLLLSVLFSIAIGLRLHARPDSTSVTSADYVLSIGRLNQDDIPDTVRGYRSASLQIVPGMICWGKRLRPDTPGGGDRRPERVMQTRLHLPEWRRLSVSFAMQDLNADTIADIIFYLRGDISTDRERRDTVRTFVIFGQSGLDSLRQIDLRSIGDGFQDRPFFAMDLRKGEGLELDNPSVRDPSGRRSYILRPIGHNLRRRDTTSQPIASTKDTAGDFAVSIFPNPAAISANLELRKVPPGVYRVALVAVNGSTYHRQEITVEESGEVLRTLDVRAVPTGYYVVQLNDHERLIGTYPVVIVH